MARGLALILTILVVQGVTACLLVVTLLAVVEVQDILKGVDRDEEDQRKRRRRLADDLIRRGK